MKHRKPSRTVEEFRASLEANRKVIDTWPEWKRNAFKAVPTTGKVPYEPSGWPSNSLPYTVHPVSSQVIEELLPGCTGVDYADLAKHVRDAMQAYLDKLAKNKSRV